MFDTLETFCVFFFTSLVLIILGIVFEDKFIALEKKADRKREERHRK